MQKVEAFKKNKLTQSQNSYERVLLKHRKYLTSKIILKIESATETAERAQFSAISFPH